MRSTYTVLVSAAPQRTRWLGVFGAVPTGWLAAASTLVVGVPLALTFSFFLFSEKDDAPFAGNISPEQLAELALPDLPEDGAALLAETDTSGADSVAPLSSAPREGSIETGTVVEQGESVDDEASAPDVAAVPEKSEDPSTKIIRIERGDTLLGLLARLAIPAAEAHDAMSALSKVYNPRHIKVGDEVTVNFDKTGVFSGFEFDPDLERSVRVERNSKGGGFKAASVNHALSTDTMAATTKIESSLYDSGVKAGIPVSIMSPLVKALAHSIDFQRDVRSGDTLRVLYEVKRNPDGVVVRTGRILFAEVTVRGQATPVYLYRYKDGREEYFDKDGKSLRRSLLRTPVNGARVSSGYGMRQHPVLGYSKMHRGVDFAAPTGTNIYASGDGVIVERRYKGSYGNYIRIRHNGNLSTAYAHMSRFVAGLSVGSRVRQGQVIGYVGSTGRSTGPHLHYEVLVNGTQVNPHRVANLAQSEALKGGDLSRFKNLVQEVDKAFRSVEAGRVVQVSYRQ